MQISELQLPTSDLQGTKEFYNSGLGFELLEYVPGTLALKAGSTRLVFRESATNVPPCHFALNIPADQLEAAVDFLQDKLSLIPGPDGHEVIEFYDWQARSCYFYDNNSNILECIARGTMVTAAGKKFSAESILSVSEMGIPVTDVTKAMDRIRRSSGIPVFSRQEPSDDFAALGDDEGLLIFVREGRPWFPSGIPAEAVPLRITILQQGRTELLQFPTK